MKGDIPTLTRRIDFSYEVDKVPRIVTDCTVLTCHGTSARLRWVSPLKLLSEVLRMGLNDAIISENSQFPLNTTYGRAMCSQISVEAENGGASS